MKLSKTLALLSLFIGAFTLSNCKKEIAPPSVCFLVTPDTALTGDELIFNNCSQNSNSSLWEFGDGTTSKQKSTTHIYTKSGTYEVKLTVWNSDGVSSSTSKTITIKQVPPTKLTINKVTINRWPEKNGSVTWDDNSWGSNEMYPDISIRISDFWSSYEYSVGHWLNAQPGTPVIFTPQNTGNLPIKIYDLNTKVRLECHDLDDWSYTDYMADILFAPIDEHIANASEITLANDDIEIVLDITWSY